MNDFRRTSTAELWQAIETNAQEARKHVNWVECLDNIKVLCALIDERIEVFQREKRTEQLLGKHRAKFNFGRAVEAGVLRGHGMAEAISRRRRDEV